MHVLYTKPDAVVRVCTINATQKRGRKEEEGKEGANVQNFGVRLTVNKANVCVCILNDIAGVAKFKSSWPHSS